MTTVLDFISSSGAASRPSRSNLSGRKPWAKNPSAPGADDGTRLDETLINDLIGLLRGAFDGLGHSATPGNDSDLADAINNAIAAAIADLHSPLFYAGTWNALTNSPALVSSVGTPGAMYTVSVAGATDLDGTDAWDVMDKAVFNGDTGLWERIEGTSVGEAISNLRKAYAAPHTVNDTDNGYTLALSGTAPLTFGAASGYASAFACRILNEDTTQGQLITIPGFGASFSPFFLKPGQAAEVLNQNNAWQISPRHQRQRMAGSNNDFYVDFTLGDDANDGSAAGAGRAKKTVVNALGDILTEYDWDARGSHESHPVINMVDNVADTSGIHWPAHSPTFGGAGSGGIMYVRGATRAISAIANNGSGKVRLTVPSTTGYTTGELKAIEGVSGTLATALNSYMFAITVVDATHVDLADVSFSGSSSGGEITGCSEINVTGANAIDLYHDALIKFGHVRIVSDAGGVATHRSARWQLGPGVVFGKSGVTASSAHVGVGDRSYLFAETDFGIAGNSSFDFIQVGDYSVLNATAATVHFERNVTAGRNVIGLQDGEARFAGFNVHGHTVTGCKAAIYSPGGSLFPGSTSLSAIPGTTPVVMYGVVNYQDVLYFIGLGAVVDFSTAASVAFAAGSVSAPSFFPTGDTNTGPFFPAADIMAIAAGGVEQVRWGGVAKETIGSGSGTAPTNPPSLYLPSPNTGSGSVVAMRQGNNVAYGFDWSVEQTNGGLVLEGVQNNVSARAMEVSRGGQFSLGAGNPAAQNSRLIISKSAQTDNTDSALFVAGATTTKGVAIGFNESSDYGYIQPVNRGGSYKNLILTPEGGNLGVGTNLSPQSKLQVNGAITTTAVTVATLPAANAVTGQRHFVTDANTTLALGLGLAVVGGGANKVPVYSDGTNWIIGG